MRQRTINWSGAMRDMRNARQGQQHKEPVVPLPEISPETKTWAAAVDRKAKARRAKRKA